MNSSRCWLLVAAAVAAGCSEATGVQNPVIDDAPRATSWAAVAAATYNTCGLIADSSAYCWGFRLPGVCSNTGCAVDGIPVKVQGTVKFASISGGNARACGLTAAQTVYCWGESDFHATLGDGVTDTSATPVLVATTQPIAVVSVGYQHACVLDTQGTASCWGSGFGVIGNGGGGTSLQLVKTPTPVSTTVKFASISAGAGHTCGVAMDGDAWCWGSGSGVLGLGARDTSCAFGPSCYIATTPELVVGGIKWKSVSAGSTNTCGVATDGKGYCWGGMFSASNSIKQTGELGSGSLDGSKVPVVIAGGHTFKSLFAGAYRACGITEAGDAYCWGYSASGTHGIGLNGTYPTPQLVFGHLHFESLSLAQTTTCGVSAGHNAYCWGITYGGKLGNGITVGGIQAMPVRVSAPAS